MGNALILTIICITQVQRDKEHAAQMRALKEARADPERSLHELRRLCQEQAKSSYCTTAERGEWEKVAEQLDQCVGCEIDKSSFLIIGGLIADQVHLAYHRNTTPYSGVEYDTSQAHRWSASKKVS